MLAGLLLYIQLVWMKLSVHHSRANFRNSATIRPKIIRSRIWYDYFYRHKTSLRNKTVSCKFVNLYAYGPELDP